MMPDFGKLDQCRMLAKCLWFLPPPARAPIADGLYGLGVRVHPELASKELVTEGPAGFGPHRPQRLAKIQSRTDAMDIIRQFNPELAGKLDAAETERQKQDLLAEIRQKIPEVIARAEQRLAEVSPEDLG